MVRKFGLMLKSGDEIAVKQLYFIYLQQIKIYG